MSYTRADLREELPAFNEKLRQLGSPERLEVEGRNGYTAVDITREFMTFPNGGCESRISHERTLANGSPRECRTAILEHIVNKIR